MKNYELERGRTGASPGPAKLHGTVAPPAMFGGITGVKGHTAVALTAPPPPLCSNFPLQTRLLLLADVFSVFLAFFPSTFTFFGLLCLRFLEAQMSESIL